MHENMEPVPELENIAFKAVHCRECFSDGKLRSSYVDIAQPRYIGPGYWKSSQKVAFVMLNPGAGKDDWRNVDWKNHIYGFRDGIESIHDIFSAQRRHMPYWGGGKLISFIKLHGLDVDDLALVNIAWCATKENKYPVWMLKQCFKLHTYDWLAEIRPQVVILSGTGTHQFASELNGLTKQIKIFKSFHYAHRPLDAERAESRAREIAEQISDKHAAKHVHKAGQTIRHAQTLPRTRSFRARESRLNSNLFTHNQAGNNMNTKRELDRMKSLFENLEISPKFSSIHHFSSNKFATKPPGLKGFYNWCKYREILDENLQTIRRALRTADLMQKGYDFENASATAWKEFPVCKR